MNHLRSRPIVAFFALAALYVLLIPFPFPGRFLLKASPIWLLAFVAWRMVGGRDGRILAVALLLSSVGDILLELDRGNLFVPGLLFFLLAHVVYIVVFVPGVRFRRERAPIAVLLAIYVLVLSVLLIPNLGGMLFPVLAYIVVITVMGMTAIFYEVDNVFVMLGALTFILSDSFIAINRFLTPLPADRYAVMLTYYAAQFLITYGFLRATKSVPRAAAVP